jgi:arginine decarboxylase
VPAPANVSLEFDVVWVGPLATTLGREFRRLLRECGEGRAQPMAPRVVHAPLTADLRPILEEHANAQSVVVHAAADEATADLAQQARRLRPELDLYLYTTTSFTAVADPVHRMFDRLAFPEEPLRDLAQAVVAGVAARYRTPFFDALTAYGQRPVASFHALPIARGASVSGSRWIGDFGEHFQNIMLAESSATHGGLDSLMHPTGPLKMAQALAATAYGADRSFFVTNGTSTANKIVLQAVTRPGDLVLINRDCHQSHHYGLMQSGAVAVYLPSWPLPEHSLTGAVPLEAILATLEDVRRADLLHRVRATVLTNCTFDGLLYDTERVMEALLAVKDDMVFLWDEAWFAYARFNPRLRPRTAMEAARNLERKYGSTGYRAEYETHVRELTPGERPRLPDPDRVRIRVYATQSTHKTMTSFRQGSMIHVLDEDFEEESASVFREAYLTHSSTSPNYAILASLDVGRRQAQLEGYAMVEEGLARALELRQAIASRPALRKYFDVLDEDDMIPTAPDGARLDGCALDLMKITLSVARTGLTGTAFKRLLMDRFGIQVNKTSLNTVLLITNIGTLAASQAKLLSALLEIAGLLDRGLLEEAALPVRPARAMPDVSPFHPRFQLLPGGAAGDVRAAFYLAYDSGACAHITVDEALERARAGDESVSASFVTPYPPGYPLLVPGQIASVSLLEFLATLEPDEILGLESGRYLRVFRPEVLVASELSPLASATLAV